MPVLQNNWYNLHSTRQYPLDDKATGTDDTGLRLPADVLLDCHLRFPRTAGRWAFLGGITVTDTLVTLLFLATDAVTDTARFTPLAAVSVLRGKVSPDTHIPVQALYPGTGGFVVLGDVTENFVGRFSQPAQSLLSPRTARAYNKLPVSTLGKLGRDRGLTGLVTLRAGNDLEIVRASREIQDHGTVNALIFRLRQVPGAANVLEKYIGPCQARPESRNCFRDGIETLNETRPDCTGNLDICFRHLDTYPYGSAGLVIDHPVALQQVCQTRDPERFAGRDLCLPSVSSYSSSLSLSSVSQAVPSSDSSASSEFFVSLLPYHENFDHGAADFTVAAGTFVFNDIDSPAELYPGFASLSSSVSAVCSFSSWSSASSLGPPDLIEWTAPCIQVVPYSEPISQAYTATSLAQRNIAVWAAHGYVSSLQKRITTDLRLTADGDQQNGGIVVNYHTVDPLTNPHVEYLHAILNRRDHELQLWWFAGLAPLVKIAQVSLGQVVRAGDWYRMQVDTLAAAQEVVSIQVTGISDLSWPAATLSVPVGAQFKADDGLFGLGSIRARCGFSFFSVEAL